MLFYEPMSSWWITFHTIQIVSFVYEGYCPEIVRIDYVTFNSCREIEEKNKFENQWHRLHFIYFDYKMANLRLKRNAKNQIRFWMGEIHFKIIEKLNYSLAEASTNSCGSKRKMERSISSLYGFINNPHHLGESLDLLKSVFENALIHPTHLTIEIR